MTKFDYEIDDFMCYCDSKKLSKKTKRSYEQTLRLFAKYLKEEKGVESTKEVTTDMVREYIVYLRERGKYTVISNENSREWNNPQNRTDYSKQITNTTINNYIRNLKVYFNFMKDYNEKITQIPNKRDLKEYTIQNEYFKKIREIEDKKAWKT